MSSFFKKFTKAITHSSIGCHSFKKIKSCIETGHRRATARAHQPCILFFIVGVFVGVVIGVFRVVIGVKIQRFVNERVG
jgi:hypothetical protein